MRERKRLQQEKTNNEHKDPKMNEILKWKLEKLQVRSCIIYDHPKAEEHSNSKIKN